MRYDRTFGVIAPEIGWVPAPRYLMRRDHVLSLLEDLCPGRVLEVGCGSGALLCDLARMGFEGVGVDTSQPARNMAMQLLELYNSFRVRTSIEYEEECSFDYLLALEVLEHIQDDTGALRDWHAMLKPEGLLILSVPADPERWSADDVWAGHCRRYDRQRVVQKLEHAGFHAVSVIRYGWPLTSVIDPIRARIRAYQMRRESEMGEADSSPKVRSHRSGVDRRVEVSAFFLYGNSVGKALFRGLFRLQRTVANRKLGTGFLVTARATSQLQREHEIN